jgi:hypothetical protein
MHVNFLTVPRLPGQAVGGITKLDNVATGESMTLNVEYNQLDPLLRATVSPKGDVAGPDGLSPYPGNINQFVTSRVRCIPLRTATRRTVAFRLAPLSPFFATPSLGPGVRALRGDAGADVGRHGRVCEPEVRRLEKDAV